MYKLVRYDDNNMPQFVKTALLDLYNQFFPRKPGKPPRSLEWFNKLSQMRTCFLLLDNQIIVSHASILRKNIIHAKKKYKLAGLGGVLTRFEYQKKGYGTQIVKLATKFINNQDFDIAVLFCHRNKEAFYRQNGWEILNNDSIVIEEENTHPQLQDELTMIQYISAVAKGDKALFEDKPIFFGESW